MEYFVYYIYSKKLDKFYIGKTNDLRRRLKEHNNGEEKYTQKGAPWLLIGYIEYKNNNEATKSELKLKKAKNPKYVNWYIKTYGKNTI
ncbi:MAG: hypothetical protein A2469_00110 [Candidatus Magasanikbacteria bacterium RIFOXYC2_FULL_40_16]|uniref:GIY-YIG domain-containing protein n=3 Tax=Candidatus Magasanikiibacteriota TaxID=1752731 RepID=A0A1F6NHT3_9BACT|nr:MAG: hypothetical protein A2224_02565 [Candidatus Magasanikbacteria bacterium RIFOXYA2_FULL_40_20]OGH83467.1 MAG: hypothetical protein A2373_04005 [Candidatus Magasanikbacteria bacterium RIFOXYB1_FULL_40_15]OGH86287.1 MAG: hypothetical protein A2301_03805 [Candidatus Magasanikbacteria bacterium RIFOXYB2_FULL_40_13]OGH87177.1 MAG: hypothetical protein A2206_03860 [Candidatus Magasanikbacteria bacterium RIFOXYA1_FULL_40_8]OGH89669.1 MAG: hypothetical protein A2469_00110 [Candidatus Magasanikba